MERHENAQERESPLGTRNRMFRHCHLIPEEEMIAYDEAFPNQQVAYPRKEIKTAFSTLGCLEADMNDVRAYALRNYIDAVEPRVNDKGEVFGTSTIDDAKDIWSAFKTAGIEITDLAISCSISKYDKKQIEIGKNGIDFACLLQVRGVRVFVGTHQKHFTDKDTSDVEGMIKALRELADYGKEKNVDILLETHSSFSTGRAMKGLVDVVQRDNIKVIWDVLHSLEYGEAPAETVGYLGNKIVHVHMKDGRPGDDAQSTQFIHTDLGEGVMPVKQVISALKSIDYDGYYSLEWEAPWRDELKGMYTNFNDLLDKYNRFIGAEKDC